MQRRFLDERLMWNPERELGMYPSKVQKPFRADAQTLLEDLRRRYLSVVLVPAPEPQFSGHKIRAVENRNPPWYRELWEEHAYQRPGKIKLSSLLKRARLTDSLTRIELGHDMSLQSTGNERVIPFKYTYDTLARQVIFNRLILGYEDEECGEVPPHEDIVAYFRRGVKGVMAAKL